MRLGNRKDVKAARKSTDINVSFREETLLRSEWYWKVMRREDWEETPF